MTKHIQRPFVLAAGLALAACGTPRLDTRTFELQYLEGHEAAQLIDPYVWGDRPDAPGTLSVVEGAITVRETPDNLEKIATVLAEFDRAQPHVRVLFQVIEANGRSGADPAIAEVEEELRRLFRFDGYRLAAEASIGGTEGSTIEQVVGNRGPGENTWIITARIHRVRAAGDSGIVGLTVGVRSMLRGALETTVNARIGQTVVVGNAQLADDGGTVILTVRPELVGG